MRGKNQSIHAERVDLAETYAEDGAFYTAARIFKELAEDVEAHAKETEVKAIFAHLK